MEREKDCCEKWRFSQYFQFICRKDKNISVKCTICLGNKRLSTAAHSMSNLSNLANQHNNVKLVVKDPLAAAAAPRAVDGQPPLNAKLFSCLGTVQVTQNELKKLVAGYIIEDMLPLSTIESPRFRKILSKIPAPGKTFCSYLDKCHKDMESNLKITFESLEYVSTTADIWSTNNKSYLANEKEQVHSTYGLTHRVTACITDNGSNFMNAFRMFEQPVAIQSDGSDSDEDQSDYKEVTLTEVAEVLSTEPEECFSLPPHLHCASHTLNLITKNDLDKWLTSSECRVVYRKCSREVYSFVDKKCSLYCGLRPD
ncbi:hypothetical protein ABVT39_005538 [Epinephelus coioides]